MKEGDRERVCVGEREWKRERETERWCVRERERGCMRQCGRERNREGEGVGREREGVCERES